ncbi:ClpP/crotonase [Meira miltonrushii]|uniref:ClpP/crotonase n=1 Tax=Meira miltonrushii TaxID=1280837 RepID=A0A316VK87_9BASI|nr:ClpP/crotonase [Meira miltonrushii]PWN37930.1 ClpP/crotonase [Meira miltonrushii]
MASNGDGAIKQYRLLIANRGEIALRIQRTALLFPRPEHPNVQFIPFVLYTQGEEDALHVTSVPKEQRMLLQGIGPRAYLDGEQIVRLAKEKDIWGIAPGYGFLSESPQFARLVEENGMIWCGPTVEQLSLLSDKVLAKRLARQCNVPTLESTTGDHASLAEIQSFAAELKNKSKGDAKVIIKAVNGGGGRGMRVVDLSQPNAKNLVDEAFAACAREAKASFGDEKLYAERFLSQARHIEVQVIGDGKGSVTHLWERECSIQRRHQKVIEIAPSPTLTAEVRQQILKASLRMAKEVKYKNLGTFEFLLLPETGEFFFMEINPRIQVEHTITEAITGQDLVAIQLRIALGCALNELGLQNNVLPTRTAIQTRINAEKFLPDGNVIPTSGKLTSFNLPSGPNIRIDTSAHPPIGHRFYQQTPLFDSLLAKVIFSAPTYPLAVQLADAALATSVIEGADSNLFFVRSLLQDEAVRTNRDVHTRFIEQNFESLFKTAQALQQDSASINGRSESTQEDHQSASPSNAPPEGQQSIKSPLSGLVTQVSVEIGQKVQKGQEVALLESMKMEHVIRAEAQGTVRQILAKKGSSINEGDAIVFVESSDNDKDQKNDQANIAAEEEEDSSVLRPDLEELLKTRQLQSDEVRQTAVKRRKAAGYLTARENVARLIDEGTFIEWGDLAIAAQRTRTDEEELRERTSNDGVITGWATVNGKLLDKKEFQSASNARCALCIYDYMVLAGTQGHFHHLKLDRLFRSILQNPAPVIVYAEGGGGRPGDVDLVNMKVGGLDTPSFALLAAIQARGYPSVGLANGYTFAGNAALLGTCDIVVATEGGAKDAPKRGATSTGMGGPAMIEGGGLGKVAPQDVGSVEIHFKNGDYDIVVPTEVEASVVIKQLIGFFQGPLESPHWRYTKNEKDLRKALPKQRTRAYEVRNVIEMLSDDNTFVELGNGWGHSLVTGLARFAGQPIGILASSVLSPLGGAIDVQSAKKATRLVNMLHRTKAAHLLILCDTPGFMVGTPAEKEGGLRAFAEFFSAITGFQEGHNGGRIFGVTLRKAYGLGAQALLGGSTLANFFSVAWPQAEFAAMGIEGAVRLGMRKELEAAAEGAERDDLFQSLVDMMYQRGKAQNMATMAEIDTVIDPAETRQWLINGLRFTRTRTPTWKADSKVHSSHL